MESQRITILLSSVLGFLTLLFTDHIREEKLQALQRGLSAEIRAGKAAGGKGGKGRGALDDAEVSRSLLLDAVLSIIQNYYVDRERARADELQRLAVSYAKEEEGVTVAEAPERVVLKRQGKEVVVPKHPGMGFRDILNNAIAIEDFLESTASPATAKAPAKAGEDGPRQGTIVQRFLNGMLTRLDPHSVFLDNDAYTELMQGTEGVFGGLGVVVGIRDNILTVIKPIPNSPAARAGIRKFDKIMRIGPVDTFGYTLDELVEHMRGAPGTSVNLSLLRDGGLSPADLTLTREVIQVQTVEAKKITAAHGSYLHVAVESFASRTSHEVASAIKQGLKETNGQLAGVILDLRSNPGGLLDQAVEVADLFLTEGAIVTTKGRREEVEKAGIGFNEFSMPLVVLINPESASASEIVAGALQDNRRAVVIGQPSFGKGSVQTIFKLPGDQALKLTIARYYTPGGGSIQNIGIMPDIWVQPTLRGPTNENLLGDYRYRSERFLANHLEMSPEDRAMQEKTGKNLSWKSYYLTDTTPDVTEPKNDREFNLAVGLLDEVARVYGSRAPEGTQRSTHWLALASNRLFKELRAEDEATLAYLSAQHHVDWSPSVAEAGAVAPPKMAFEIAPKANLDASHSDGIPYAVSNLGDRDVARLSLFVRPSFPGGGTYEVLLGRLPKGAKRQGLIPLSALRAAPDGAFDMDVGLAVDATPVPSLGRKVAVKLANRADVALDASFEFRDDPAFKLKSVLEPKEKARLLVTLVNKGKRVIRNLAATAYNLSGGQVTVESGKARFDALKPGETRSVEVVIKAGPRLLTTRANVGVRVESEDLLGPAKFYQSLPMAPNMVNVAKENALAH